jgi:hypothetical protein
MLWVFQKPKPAEPTPAPEPKLVLKETKQDKEPPPPEPEKPKEAPLPPRTREALDKAAAHLKKRLLEPGSRLTLDTRYSPDGPTGAAALVGLALLEAKVPPDDPAVQKALATVRAGVPALRLVYAQGACVFFLNRLHDIEPLQKSDRDLIRSLALRLIAGQQKEGYWTYLNPPITPQAEADLLERLRNNTYRPNGPKLSTGSNSMTQFALLSLWGSARHDVPVRPALLAAAEHFQKTQHTDGTWSYPPVKGVKGRCDSNTCAGLMALAMDQTLREDKRFRGQAVDDTPANPLADKQRDAGFAYLTKVIGRTKNDPVGPKSQGKIIRADAWGDLYFLWCLERVAVIYDLKTIGGKDWYAWGSEVILDSQRPDGSWLDSHGDVCDTCFAVLFLTRANLAKDLTESIRTRGGKAAIP